MTASQWFTYCVAVFVGGIIPGPIMLLAMTAGARRGVVSALPAAMGNVLASILQVLVSIALIGAVANNASTIFMIMMGFGGAYLIYLGVSLYRRNPFILTGTTSDYGYNNREFADVFLVTLLNPKSIMFFVALFPQVIPKDNYSATLVIAMISAFSVIALLCFSIYAAFGTWIKWLANRTHLAGAINVFLSAVFIGLGVLAIFNSLRVS